MGHRSTAQTRPRSHRPGRWTFGTWITAAAVTLAVAGCSSATPEHDHAADEPPAASAMSASALPSRHVHGVAVNPADQRVYLATHDGLFRYDENGPTRVGPVIDLMGFTIAGPDHFYASGHPATGTDLPDPVGLITSTDAGRTWTPLSRQGQSDFHALTTSPAGVIGYDGEMWRTQNTTAWQELTIPSPPMSLAGSTTGPVVLTANPAGLLRSPDNGDSWTVIPDAPSLAVLAIAGAATAVGVSANGAVHISQDAGLTWTPRGRTDQPQAITATTDAQGLRIFIATTQNVVQSTDSGHTFTPLV